MHLKEKTLSGYLPYSVALNRLSEKLKNWDFEKVSGQGFINKITGHYAHLEIEIYKTKDEVKSNKVIYRTHDKQLPYEFKKPIEESLDFFISFLKIINNRDFYLTFDIINGSYHHVDSRRRDFHKATFFALADCFGKKYRLINDDDKKLIQKLKTDSLTIDRYKTGYNKI